MKWIKASERLHDNDHEFVFLKGCRADKGILRKENVHGQTMITLYYNDGIGTKELSAWKEGHEELDSIFWLDESPSEDNHLIEALEDFLSAVPPQTDDADWWPDNLCKAVETAKRFLSQYKSQPGSLQEKQESILFLQWIRKEQWEWSELNSKWFKKGTYEYRTEEQLYELFKQGACVPENKSDREPEEKGNFNTDLLNQCTK